MTETPKNPDQDRDAVEHVAEAHRRLSGLRQQLDKHRNTESCAVCHKRIDPPGFALESFDAIGGWRQSYRIPIGDAAGLDPKKKDQWPATYKQGLPVDRTGQLPSGEAFDGIREFKALLQRDPDRIACCLTEKLLTYALGRGLGFSDRPTVEAIVARVRANRYSYSSRVKSLNCR